MSGRIITRPQSADYDEGFEQAFGRRCFYRCGRPLDPSNKAEYESQAHESCAEASRNQEDPRGEE